MMHFAESDIVVIGLATVGSIVLTLLWIHGSGQTRVSRSVSHTCRVVLRLTVVHAAAIAVLCILFPLTARAYAWFTAVMWVLAAGVSFHSSPGGTNMIEFMIGMAIIVPPYVLKQFVLGFPDRDLAIPVPDPIQPDLDPPPCDTDEGVAVSTLRPMGTIDLGGQQFNAASANGAMIEAGTPVRVSGQRGKVYLVVAVDADGAEPPRDD